MTSADLLLRAICPFYGSDGICSGLYDGYVCNIYDNNRYRGSCTRCLRWSTFHRIEGILDVWKR